MTTRRRPRPELPHEQLARRAKFAKPQYREPAEETDTKGLALRKLHPERDRCYLKWLRFRTCKVHGKTDSLTDQPHICWSYERAASTATGFMSDPSHNAKAYSGNLKRSDIPSDSSSGAISLCRLAHRFSEANADEFDRRFGINRHEIGREQYEEYLAEMERSR